MKIAQVLTYLSADGAYGGPAAVALGHCQELSRRGHDVTLFAGWDGKATVESEDFEVVLRRAKPLVPGSGFSTLVSPGLWRAVTRRLDEFDVVHVHLARDLVTAPIAAKVLRSKARLFVQTHGMVRPDTRLRAKLFYTILVKRVLAGAQACFSLTGREDSDLSGLGVHPILDITRLLNGVATAPEIAARSLGTVPEILFMSRLHPRKRVMHFAEAARLLLSDGFSGRFVVVGPDDGDLASLSPFIAADPFLTAKMTYEGSLAHADALARLARADVLVLPSVDEPFPMVVLEALSQGTPVVVTDRCGIADTVRGHGGYVVGTSAEELADSIRVVCEPTFWRTQSDGAMLLVQEKFSIFSVGERLDQAYEHALA